MTEKRLNLGIEKDYSGFLLSISFVLSVVLINILILKSKGLV